MGLVVGLGVVGRGVGGGTGLVVGAGTGLGVVGRGVGGGTGLGVVGLSVGSATGLPVGTTDCVYRSILLPVRKQI